MKLKSSTGKPVQVALLSGHCIVIDGKGRDVPKRFRQEAFRLGCIPVELEPEEMESDSKPNTPPEGDERRAAVVAEMKAMLNEGCTLTGSGLPNLNDLSTRIGYKVNKNEAAEAWNTLKAEADE